jgi:DNA-binding transcriptional LysR family regulator
MTPTFGTMHILLLPGFLARYSQVRPEWHFEDRAVDLVAEGFSAAIGGGFELSPGIVSCSLAPPHIISVASPNYMENRAPPIDPSGLQALDGIVMRSLQSSRLRQWTPLHQRLRDRPTDRLVPGLRQNQGRDRRMVLRHGSGEARDRVDVAHEAAIDKVAARNRV